MQAMIFTILLFTSLASSNDLIGNWIGECYEGSSFFDWKNTDEFACRRLIIKKDTILQQDIYFENGGKSEINKGDLVISYSLVDSNSIKLEYLQCEFLGNITTCPNVEVAKYSIDKDQLKLGPVTYYQNTKITDEKIKDNWLNKGMRLFLWIGVPSLLLFGVVNQSK